jgi:hypothetical protein
MFQITPQCIGLTLMAGSCSIMHIQVQEAIIKAIQITRFIVISCDEVTTIDYGSWICIHAYVVQFKVRIPISLQVE